MDRIFVTLSTFAEFDRTPLGLLERSGIPFSLNGTGKRITGEELFEKGGSATVLIAGVEPYDAATLDALPRLRCISRCGVGTDSIDLVRARERAVAVLNTPDPPTQAVAELAVTMMLALSRRLPVQQRHAGQREWVRLDAHLLAERRVGLIGLGRVGRRVVDLLQPFAASVAPNG